MIFQQDNFSVVEHFLLILTTIICPTRSSFQLLDLKYHLMEAFYFFHTHVFTTKTHSHKIRHKYVIFIVLYFARLFAKEIIPQFAAQKCEFVSAHIRQVFKEPS